MKHLWLTLIGKKNHDEVKLYETYVQNASIRLSGVQKLIEQGDKPAIDSIEAGITLKTDN